MGQTPSRMTFSDKVCSSFMAEMFDYLRYYKTEGAHAVLLNLPCKTTACMVVTTPAHNHTRLLTPGPLADWRHLLGYFAACRCFQSEWFTATLLSFSQASLKCSRVSLFRADEDTCQLESGYHAIRCCHTLWCASLKSQAQQQLFARQDNTSQLTQQLQQLLT